MEAPFVISCLAEPKIATVSSGEDEFICPVCGATVPAKAVACPECGSDERTGWSESTVYDDTGIEDPADFDYNEWLRRERGLAPRKSGQQRLWWVTAVVIVALIVWLVVSRIWCAI
jgi:RNA polymerase subunit RPABC4/transcription elongation factor Spt4